MTISSSVSKNNAPLVLSTSSKEPSSDFLEKVVRVAMKAHTEMQSQSSISESNENCVFFEGNFEGESKNGLPNGYGTLSFRKGNKNKVIGTFGVDEDKKVFLKETRVKIFFTDGDVYDGDVDDQLKPNGSGVYETKDGRKYDGKWVHGVKNDPGATITGPGWRYFGAISNNDLTGRGSLAFEGGDLYSGDFSFGFLNGKGVHKSGSITRSGTFQNNLLNGPGKVVYEGDPYSRKMLEANFKKGEPDGNVTLTYEDGKVYSGFLKEDLPYGKGTLTYQDTHKIKTLKADFVAGEIQGGVEADLRDGSKYFGEFKNNRFNGKGELILEDRKIETFFQNGVPEGEVRVTFRNRAIFQGRWFSESGRGDGIFQTASGDVYKGSFVDGTGELIPCGTCCKTLKSGKIKSIEAKFKNEKPIGYAEITFRDGKVFKGSIAGDTWQGEVIYPENHRCQSYGGTLKDGVLNGEGFLKMKDGDSFQGVFKDGEIISGTAFFKDGSTYEGSFKSTKAHGKGTYTYANQDVYKGELRGGLPSETGKLTRLSGEEFEGTFKKGEITSGTLNYPNEMHYEGTFKNRKPHGNGQFTFPDGTICKGTYQNGELTVGTLFFREGAEFLEYEGTFKKFIPHGVGVLKIAEDMTYSGDLKNGHPDGRGKLEISGGISYEGNFSQGLLDEKNVTILSKNYKYEGSLENNIPHGKGKARYSDGSTFEGVFEKGVPNGKGIITLSDGTSFEETVRSEPKDSEKLPAFWNISFDNFLTSSSSESSSN